MTTRPKSSLNLNHNSVPGVLTADSELEEAGFSRVVIETRAEQSRASSPWFPAVAYCQGTPLRNEIEARAAGKLPSATDYVASAIANKHGRGEVAAKIQAHIIAAVAKLLPYLLAQSRLWRPA
jgi:hypothetical protein